MLPRLASRQLWSRYCLQIALPRSRTFSLISPSTDNGTAPSDCADPLLNCVDGLPLVYDDVISDKCRAIMLSPDVFDSGPDTYRRVDGPVSPQELLIESLLQSLRLTSTREVEWWAWSEWKLAEAHRDCDEEAAAFRGEKRFPTHTVLLYLDVEPELKAPTCVWLPLRKAPNTTTLCGSNNSSLFIVPAVAKRLLVFPGHALHGVPRPVLGWFSNTDASEPLHNAQSIHERTVLVMNLWDDHAPVCEDRFDESDCSDPEADEQEEEELDAEERLDRVAPSVACQSRDVWVSVPLINPSDTQRNNSTICGMPDNSRIMLSTFSHGSDEWFVTPINSTAETVSNMFTSPRDPHWILTESNVADLGIGIPSIVGTRKERHGY